MPHKNPAAAAAFQKHWRLKNLKKIRSRRKAAYWANREKALDEARRHRLKRAYGITVEDYDRMFEAQGGTCKICLKPPKTKRLAVDHCHKTKRVRGLLCARCNSLLGRMQENADAFERAAVYLRAA